MTKATIPLKSKSLLTRFQSLYSTGDAHFVEIIRHSFWALILLSITTVIQFIFDLSLTHTFGAHGAGIFYLCFSVLMMLALVGRLGVDRAVIRFIPPLLAKHPERAAGVKKSATQLSLSITLPLTLLLFMLAPTLADKVFHSPELTVYLRIFAIAIPPLALNYVYSGVLRALKRTQLSLSIERLTMYACGIVAVLVLGNIYGLKGAFWGFIIGIFISSFEGARYINRHMPAHSKPVLFSKKQLLIVSGPLLFVVFALQMSGQTSVLLLGTFASNSDVAVFNIALRVSMLMNLVLSAISVIVGTKISELYYAKKKSEMNIMISKVSALGALVGVPTFIVLAVFSHFWLGLFGETFRAGSATLIVLAAGQLVNVIVGPTLFILSMTGREKALAAAVGVSLVINAILGFVLIPPFEVLGAAIATSTAIILSNLIMLIVVKRHFNVWSLPFRFLGQWLRV